MATEVVKNKTEKNPSDFQFGKRDTVAFQVGEFSNQVNPNILLMCFLEILLSNTMKHNVSRVEFWHYKELKKGHTAPRIYMINLQHNNCICKKNSLTFGSKF